MNQPPNMDHFGKVLRDAIQKEIERIVMEESVEAGKRVEKRVRESVGSIAATVLNRFTFERYGSDLKITVQFDKTKNQ